MLVLSGQDIRGLLDLDELIDALAAAMADLSAGRASAPDRIGVFVPESDGILAAMPGYVPSLGALVCKLVTIFPRNAASEIPTHQAMIVVIDAVTGAPTALLDGTEITDVRTGACSALSARLLAREDASTLAVLGTGVQARSHARAMVRVRPITEIRIAGRDPDRSAALARELSDELGISARGVGSYQDALHQADIVCAATHGIEPVVRREWLSPGTHVTSVRYIADGREVDDQTIIDALVCVESRATVLAPHPSGSNDLTEPIRKGLITPEHIHAELGELVAGIKPGRTSDEQITLYKSVGVAVQDATAAELALGKARDVGAGHELAL
jgi:ornithine cyclodeaminase/alanine dehydrogenase-like protein (mu-crystallin family)